MKKFFSLVLALVMALSLTTAAWGADPVTHEVADKAALTAALNTAADGDIIKLTANIDMGTDYAKVAKKLTLDLGQFIITSANTDMGTVYVGTAGDLTINATTGGVTNTVKNAIGNYGVLVVNGGTFTGDYALYNYYYDATTFGTATINGGTFQANSGDLAIANCGKLTVAGGDIETLDSSAELKVTGGSIEELAVTEPDYAPPVTETTISDGSVESLTVEAAVEDSIAISGGTFSVLPNEDYLADGYTFVGNSVEKPSKKTSTYDGLYAKGTNDASDADPVAVNIVVTPAKAVKYDKTTGELEDWGIVEHVNITGDSTDYVFVNSLKEADVVLYKDAEGKFVKFYLDAIETPDYVEGVAFKNFGDDCGEVDYDEDDGYDKALKYFTIKGVEEFVLVEEAEEYACDFYVMYNNELVPVVMLGLDKVPHKVVTESEDGDLVKVYCSACGTKAVKAPNMMSVPKGAELVDGTGAEIWYWPVSATTPSTDKVTSAETFDAGIAMYVGMSVMAAAGSAVVIGKKKD